MADTNYFKDQDIKDLPLPDGTESRFGSDFLNATKQFQVGIGSQVLRADQSGLWLGAATFADAPFSVDMQGNVIATSITITGYIPTGGAADDINDGNGLDDIDDGSTYKRAVANQLTGADRAYAGLNTDSAIIKGFLSSQLSSLSLPSTGVRVDQNGIYGRKAGATTFWIDASTGDATFAGTLLAASGTFGTVTAGTLSGQAISGSTITGSTLSTATSGQRVVLTSTLAQFYNSSGTEIVDIYADSSSYLIKGIQSGSNIYLDAGSTGTVSFLSNGTLKIIYSQASTAIYPVTTNELDMGVISHNWRDFWLGRNFEYRGIQQGVAYFGYVSGTSISTDNTLGFTVTNPSTGKYTVSHSFGNTNYIVVATTLKGSGAGDHVCKIESRNNDDFKVTTFTANDGAVSASDFMFILMKI